jgi:hypothetical protein
MESENEIEPPGEGCQDSIAFYELRPYFAATHYGRDALPKEMALHMQECPACRERWQFLIYTDPQASAAYWTEVDVLVAKFTESEQAGDAFTFPPFHEAIAEMTNAEEIPTFEQVQAAWLAVKTLPDDVERDEAAEQLASTCNFLLDRCGQAAKSAEYLNRLHNLTDPRPVSIPFYKDLGMEDKPVIALLSLASCQFTSSIREYAVIEFGPNGGLFYPEQFRNARALFEQRLNEMEQAIR